MTDDHGAEIAKCRLDEDIEHRSARAIRISAEMQRKHERHRLAAIARWNGERVVNRRRASLRERQIVDTRRQDGHLVLRVAVSRRAEQKHKDKQPRSREGHGGSDLFVSVVTFVVGF